MLSTHYTNTYVPRLGNAVNYIIAFIVVCKVSRKLTEFTWIIVLGQEANHNAKGTEFTP